MKINKDSNQDTHVAKFVWHSKCAYYSNNILQKRQPCGVPDLRLSTDGLKRGWVSTDTLVLTCASNIDFNLMNLFVVDILV